MFLKKGRALLHHSILEASREGFAVENHESAPDAELEVSEEEEEELEEVEVSEEEEELEEVAFVDDEVDEEDEEDAPGLLLSLPEYASEYQPPPLRWKAESEIFFSTTPSQDGQEGAGSEKPTILSNSSLQALQTYS